MLPAPLLDEIVSAPDGPDTIAFFDMDGTLVSGFTAFAFALERLKRPEPSDLGVGAIALAFQLGRVDFDTLLRASAQAMAGTQQEEISALARSLYRDQIASWVYPEARKIIANHRARGHRVVLISAANEFQVAHVAADLGVDHVISNRLEVDEDGRLTGEVVEPIVHGPGKAAAALEYATDQGVDLADAFFYTDGFEDLPLLEMVGHPQPLNPDRRLAREARRRGWNEVSFDSRGLPTRSQITRTVLAQGSVLPAAAAGLLTGLVNRSRRQAVNLTMSTWGDYAMSLAGVSLDVRGEEHIWSDRPCVFMFNHQSNVDGFVLMRLLRRDVTAVAKAELRRMPIVGQIFELGEVVFIDRSDTSRSVEALSGAVETLRGGLSIAIAPEGSRQPTPALGEFKKGGFHLAVAAQAPIVPIVIHNSLDVQPRGSVVFRPGPIRVDVLEPIATTGLSADDVGALLQRTRERFLRTLGQDLPEPD